MTISLFEIEIVDNQTRIIFLVSNSIMGDENFKFNWNAKCNLNYA